MDNNFPKLKTIMGQPVRDVLHPGEDKYFKENTHVGGMASESGDIILNPYSNLDESQKTAVAENEAVRLYLKNNNITPPFDITSEQKKSFSTIDQGKPYGDAEETTYKNTLLGRIISGDSSAGQVTPEQENFANQIKKRMGRR